MELLKSQRLEQAIAAAREGSRNLPGLSEGARCRIAAALAVPRRAPRAWVAPFIPLPRLALTAALPAAAAALLVAFGARGPEPAGDQVARVAAIKDGKHVRFVVAEGTGAQRVYRSTAPGGGEGSRLLDVREGAFRDRLDDQATIVFYRVE